jgi:putative peptidoglycan lipid II flippase
MFLRAGALSLALLLASRLLGLLRESVQAAAFGASGLADAVVLMLTLPDWLAGVLASGALAYVMLPAWAASDAASVAAAQRKLTKLLLALGALLALALAASRGPLLGVLADGLPTALRPHGAQGLLWSALALPLALLAALGVTRLQHEREFVGMYGANLAVNVVLVAALAAAGAWTSAAPAQSIALLGGGLLAAMAARLLWLAWRQRPFAAPVQPMAGAGELPAVALWVWAILAAGLPLALPFAARSIASGAGEGSLAVFNYAWKLLELPLMLGIQLVAALAFPGIARALAAPAEEGREAACRAAIRPAFALAFVLGCASAAALVWAAPALARLLFGWGRMDIASLARVADWARTGAWTLPAQALIAVVLVVLAGQGRLRPVVLAHGAAMLALLAAAGWGGLIDGQSVMVVLALLLSAVALAALAALGKGARGWLPWPAIACAGAMLLLSFLVHEAASELAHSPLRQLGAAAIWALLVFGAAALASADLRAGLRR